MENIDNISNEENELGGMATAVPSGNNVGVGVTDAALSREAYTLAAAETEPTFADEYFEKMDAISKGYSELGERILEGDKRKQIAYESQVAQATELIKLKVDPLVTPEVQAGADAAANAVLAKDLSELSKYSAESKAVDRLMSLGATDPVQARVFAQTLQTPDVASLYRDNAIKTMALQNVAARWSEAKEDQNLVADVLDFAGSLLGEVMALPAAMSRTGLVNLTEEGTIAKLFTTGDVIKNEISALYSLPVDKFVEYVNSDLASNLVSKNTFLGYTNVTSGLTAANQFLGYDDFDRKFDNVNAVVNLATAPGVGMAAKFVKSGTLGLNLALTGRANVRNAVMMATVKTQQEGAAAAARATGMTEDEVTSAVVSASADTSKVNPSFSFAPEVDEMFKKIQEFTEKLAITKPSRLAPDEAERAEIDAIASVSKRLNTEPVDIQIKEVPLVTGGSVKKVVAVFGDGEATAEDAIAVGKALGFDEVGAETRVVADGTGRWFAKVEIDIPETGFRTNGLNVPDYTFAGRFLRFLASGRSLSDRDLADIAELGMSGSRQLVTTFNDFIKPMQALTNKERYHVQEVMRRGIIKEEWYTDAQFLDLYEASYAGQKARNPERALAAYKAYKDYNDIEWALRNDVLYENLAKEGYSTVGFSSSRVTVTDQNAIVKSDWKKITDTADDNYRVYDASNNIHYHKNNKLLGDKLDQYKEGDYVLVKTQFAQKLQDGTVVQNFLIKKPDLIEKPLGRIQVGYSAGGHRMYTDKYFVKQAVRHTQADTGQQVLLAPNTFIAAPSRGAAQKWANVMDQARLAYKEGGKNAADAVFAAAGRKGFPSTEEFVASITRGDIPINEKFEVVFDRELPSAYSSAGVDPRTFMDSSELQNSSAGILKTQGRMFYSGKGEVLKDTMGQEAAIVDPYDMMATSMRNVARTVGMNEYRVQAIERWFNTFKDKLDFRRTSGASPYEAFMHAQVDSSVPIAERDQIEAQRETIKRTLGFESNYDKGMQRFARQMFEWVAGNEESGWKVTAGRKLYGAIAEKSFTGSLRGLIFDAKLGMFNPAQLLLQMSTLFSAASIRPQNAGQAMLTMYPLRAILYKSKGQNIKDIDNLISQAVKSAKIDAMGFATEQEYKDFLKFAATSGRFKFSAEDTIVANFNSSAAYGELGGAFQKFREAGRIFFNEGEMANQLFAYHLAWKEVREMFPAMATTSPEFAAKVVGRTEDYSFRMMSGSKAAWQANGLASLPTQFWAYPMRVFEASGLLGNARSGFTRAQQARLIVTQAALFGIPGIPFMQTLTDLISSKTGEGPELGSLSGLFGRGLIDNSIYALWDQDINVGKRLAVGSFVDDLLAEAFGYSAFGDVAPVDLAGGASLSVLGNIGTTLYNIIKWQYALKGNEEGLNATDLDLHMNFFREISTINNAMNGLYAYNYGRMMTRKGRELFDVDPGSAAFIAMGFRPGEENRIKIDMAYLKNKKEHIESAAGVVHKLRQEWIDDPSKYEENMKKVQVFMAVQPEEWKTDITRKAWERLDKSTLQGLEEKVTRDIRNREGISEEEEN